MTWSNRRVVRTPTDVVQDAKPTKTTYLFSSSSIEHPEEDTTLTVEGFHILSKSTFWGPEGPAVLTLYEVDPVTGQGIGSPVFMQNLNYTRCNQYCDSFLNDHFSTAITIPGVLSKRAGCTGLVSTAVVILARVPRNTLVHG